MSRQLSFTAPSFKTWDSSSGETNLPPFATTEGGKLYPATLVAAENCRFSQNGGVEIRGGSLNKGSLGTGLKVDSLEGFESDLLECIFAKSGTKIFVSNDADQQTPHWFDIGVTRTAAEKDFLFAKRKDMFANNQTDSELRIFMSIVRAIDVAGGKLTIPMGDLDDLADSGTFNVHGIAITYVKGTTFTVDSTSDIFTSAAHGLVNGTILTVSNSGGALPAGLVAATTYFVIAATTDTFQVSTTLGGSAVNMSDTGSGTNKFTAEDGIIRNCVGLTADIVVGDILTQSMTYADNPKASCMSEIEGAALVGGVLQDATSAKYSVQSTGENPEFFYDFSSDGSGSKPMPRDIRALLSGTSLTLIGLSKGLQYATGFNDDGSLLTTPLNSKHPISNAKCMEQQDEDFIILTDEGRILPVGQTNAGFKVIEDPKKPRNDLDYPVQGYIQQNMDKGNTENNFQHYDPSKRIVTNCIQLFTGNSAEFILSTDTGGWSLDTGKTFACKTNWKGRVYCGSDNMDIVYQQDEGLDDDGIDIGFRILTGQLNIANSSVEFDVMGCTIGGMLSVIGQFIVNFYADGDLAYTTTITAAEMIEKGQMKVPTTMGVGTNQIGAHRIGGSSGQDTYAFTIPIDLMFECHTLQIEMLSTDAIRITNFTVPIETESEELIETD